MATDYYNSRGQKIGFIENGTYWTARNATLGQIFLKKSVFNGAKKEIPIAIDKNVVENLIKRGINSVVFTIIGIEKRSYDVKIKTENILKVGVEINYDKRGAEGVNYTGYSTQYVISSATDCIRLMPNQKTLIDLQETEYF